MYSMSQYSNNPDKVTYFAETDYRSRRIKFGIRDDDRGRHMYIIGKTGMGKSTMLENLAIQDIQNGEGLCFIDPHGGTAETLLSYVPEERVKDVIYFAPFDIEHPISFNVMEDVGPNKRHLVVSGLMSAFKKLFGEESFSDRMQYILQNTILALLEYPDATMLGINRMLTDKEYRKKVVANVTDESVKAYWTQEFASYTERFAAEATPAIQNKIGQFTSNPLIRDIIGQPKSSFDLRKIMDEKKIVIINLSKGRVGEANANLLGSILITKIYLAAMSRADVGPETVKNLPPFYLYVDEFQSFANESFADILSEARKYKLSLTVAHQYIEQMSDEVRAAVFGNVGTMVSFRVGSYDAEVLEKEFAPAFTAEDIVNLGFAQIYLKLMIKGVGSPPFSATTINRPKTPTRTFSEDVIASSRQQFTRPRAVVESEIAKWHEPITPAPRDPNTPPETRKYAPGTRPPSTQASSVSAYGGIRAQTVTPIVPARTLETPTITVPKKYPEKIATPSIEIKHQPFKQQFTAIVDKETSDNPFFPQLSRRVAPKIEKPIVESVVTPSPQIARSSRPETPLSTLKNNPKKDKGPSEENLSSLRQALQAVLAPKEEKKSIETGEGALPLQKHEFSATSHSSNSTTSLHRERSPHIPPVQKKEEPRAPLLDTSFIQPLPKEVPEDILKKVLAD